MEEEQEASCKMTTSKTKRTCTKNPKTPNKPFVSPVIRRCGHEDKEQIQSAKRTRFEDISKEERTCLFEDKTGQIHSSAATSGEEFKPASGTPDDHEPSTPTGQDDLELKELKLILKEKQETLRKLNLVRMYRKKNNLESLQMLINKWRSVSQEAATSLLNSIPEGDEPTMSQLLQELQINQELIHYSTENESFW